MMYLATNICALFLCATAIRYACSFVGTDSSAENDSIRLETAGLDVMYDNILDDDVEEMMINKYRSELDYGCPGLDYLGVGYDSIYANSLGADESMLDAGYRAPIIEFTWRKNSQGYSPTLGSLYPVGGWVRPVFSCGRTSKIHEVNDMEDAKQAISASAKLDGDVPFNAFSGSVAYKDVLSNLKSKKQKIYNKTEQCIRYQVGIPLNLPWKFVDSFTDALENLPVLKRGETNKCDFRDIRGNVKVECKSVSIWMKFFEMFGTHCTHQLTLGGKITQTIKFDSERLEDLRVKGFDVELAISSELGSANASLSDKKRAQKAILEDIGFKRLSVIGGNMPKFPLTDTEFANWGASVAQNPMPVNIVATSIKRFLNPMLHDSFDEALQQYAVINGVSYEELQNISGRSGLINIMDGETVISWNNQEIDLKCPNGHKVLFGFSLIFGNGGKFSGILKCKTKTNGCNLPYDKSIKNTLSWLFCTAGIQPNINQVVGTSEGDDKGNINVRCPVSTIVSFGIIIKSGKDSIMSIERCKPGLPSCSASGEHSATLYIWIVCYGKKISSRNVNLEVSLSPNKELKCKEGEKIVSGFMSHILLNDKNEEIRVKPCEKYSDSCSFGCEKCKSLNVILCQEIDLK